MARSLSSQFQLEPAEPGGVRGAAGGWKELASHLGCHEWHNHYYADGGTSTYVNGERQ